MSEPDRMLSALIDAANAEAEPTRGDFARVHGKLTRHAGAAALAAAIPTTVLGSAMAATGGLAKLLGVLGVLAITGGGVAYGVHTSRTEHAFHAAVVPTAATVTNRVDTTAASSAPIGYEAPALPAAGPLPTEPSLASPTLATKPAAMNIAVRPSHSVATQASVAAPSSMLQEEYALITRAQGALRSHDPAAALVSLDEHGARFPRGQLGEEREALRVLAVCSLGRPEARAIAEKFLRAHPTSPLAPRIRQACDR